MRKSTARESMAPSAGVRTRLGALHFLEVGNIKDQRNFKDRSVFSGAANQMLSFLEDHNFPQQIALKLLEQPTTALVTQIFKFLMGIASTGYDMGSKRLEEEFPQVMADLRYPYPLKKSHVQSATTPTGWPVIFGALHWLMEACENTGEYIKLRDGKSWREYNFKQYESFLLDRPVASEVVDDMRRMLLDDLKGKRQTALQHSAKVDAVTSQLSDLEDEITEMTTLRLRIKEDSSEIQHVKMEIEQAKSSLESLEKKETFAANKLSTTESQWTEIGQQLDQLQDAIAQQPVNKDVIVTTRQVIKKLNLELGDTEQDIEHYISLIHDTQSEISQRKAPVDEQLVRFRSMVNHLLSQLSRLSIATDPTNLGMSLPGDAFEQLACFKQKITPACTEVVDTLNEEWMSNKQRLREFSTIKENVMCIQDRINRELDFLKDQNKRFLEEERQNREREERRLYEWRSQEEEQAAKRRAHIAELDARNADVRHHIATIDKEIENECRLLTDRARTYEQVLSHIAGTAAEAYKPVTESMLRALQAVRENQKREEEVLRRGLEMACQNSLLKECLDEVLAERKAAGIQSSI